MKAEKRRIKIGVPYLEETAESVRLCAPVLLRGQEQAMWFSVDREYGEYLTVDRADAFVVSVLATAMRDGADIVCEAPVTRRLLYQLNHYLVPMMAANMDVFHPITIHAVPTEAEISCAGAVGIGWSGGVDCMFALMQSFYAEEMGYRPTHLLITSNGALEEANNTMALMQLVKRTKETIADKMKLKVIGVDTNIQDILSELFISVVSFRHAAVVLSLQKLFRIFYRAASYEFSRFSFDADCSSYYDLAVLGHLETDNTVLYSAGGAYSRVQKLQALAEYPLAHKYLHPCIHILGENCGRCGKCVRTEAALYGLGTLDRFAEVFDVEQFERDKDWYFAQVLANQRSQHYGEALVLLRKRGVDLSRAEQLARSIRAAKAVVERNKVWLSEKLIGE